MSTAPTESMGATRLRRALTVGIVLTALMACSCATVRPWERGILAHECMQIPVDPIEAAYFAHVWSVREGSHGGLGVGGGGCGCN